MIRRDEKFNALQWRKRKRDDEILEKGDFIHRRQDCPYSVVLHAENREDVDNDIFIIFNANC